MAWGLQGLPECDVIPAEVDPQASQASFPFSPPLHQISRVLLNRTFSLDMEGQR